ncbi:MAG: hypothetical protein DMD98_21315, partial [Candidatus Rokuibacteriota bacterium]
ANSSWWLNTQPTATNAPAHMQSPELGFQSRVIDARRPVHDRVSMLPNLVVILGGMLAKRCVVPVTTEETRG